MTDESQNAEPKLWTFNICVPPGKQQELADLIHSNPDFEIYRMYVPGEGDWRDS
ncbi:hypothetical protein ACFWYW_55465 [Nonomuraea sp. NPDC059023]|uniref:hypothetical protein n=1 Tax=unclassified Nonomuraea TaxID=2593643 RepID=UPI00367892E1